MVQNEEHMHEMCPFNLEPLPPSLPHSRDEWTRPFSSTFAYCKRSKTEWWQDLGMRLGYANSGVISCDNILQCDWTMHTVSNTVCMYTVH